MWFKINCLEKVIGESGDSFFGGGGVWQLHPSIHISCVNNDQCINLTSKTILTRYRSGTFSPSSGQTESTSALQTKSNVMILVSFPQRIDH